jgi:hypothetical protein
VLELSKIRMTIEKYQALLCSAFANNMTTIPKRPARRLSVIFAIIQRKIVGEVVNPKTGSKPTPCWLLTSLNLKMAKIKTGNDKIGITIIPAIPKKYTNGIEMKGYRTLGADKPHVALFSGESRLTSKNYY